MFLLRGVSRLMPSAKAPPQQAPPQPAESVGTVVGARHTGQQCHSGAPWSKEQTRVKHSVRQTQVWPEQWDRAKRGTRRAATPSRKWERARRGDNLDQGDSGLARAWPQGVPARYDHTGQNFNVEPGAGGTVTEP